MHSQLISHQPFNQMLNLSDIRSGGRCFAYSMLYYTYIFMDRFIANDPEKDQVDYTAFSKVLQNIDADLRAQIQNMPELTSEILNKKLAPLTSNHLIGQNFPIEVMCKKLLRLISIERETFYFLGYDDKTQKFAGISHNVSHFVAIYAKNNGEFHLFDSISGLYILKLPENINEKELSEDLLELLFKKNFMFKHFFNYSPKTTTFDLYHSSFYFGFQNTPISSYLSSLVIEVLLTKEIPSYKQLYFNNGVTINDVDYVVIDDEENDAKNYFRLNDMKLFFKLNLLVAKEQVKYNKTIASTLTHDDSTSNSSYQRGIKLFSAFSNNNNNNNHHNENKPKNPPHHKFFCSI